MAFNNLAQALQNRFGGNQDYYDDEDYYDEEEYVEEKRPKKKASLPKIAPFASKKNNYEEPSADHEMVAIQPKSVEDARQITDLLIEGHSVILNTLNCSEDLARRVFDFACGTVYALNGSFGKISCAQQNSPMGIYIITPENVNISGAFQENFME